MSSHHIVRDEQEPALIVATVDYNDDILNSLLEWSPVVICTWEAFQLLWLQNTKVDVVIGNETDRHDFLKLGLPNTKFLTLENTDFLTSAQYYLQAREHRGANILVDEVNEEFLSTIIESDKLDVVVFDNDSKWVCAKESYKKWLSVNSTILLRGDITSISLNDHALDINLKEIRLETEGFLKVEGNNFRLGETL